MYIQLLTHQNMDIDGMARGYHPGDWVDIGKQSALALIARGDARAVEPVKFEAHPKAGIVLTGSAAQGKKHLARLQVEMATEEGQPRLEYERTIIWDAAVPLRVDLLTPGLAFLDKWEICVPLLSYTTLARDVGTAEERAATEAVIRDLRVPLYDTRLMFVRRCEATQRLFELWQGSTGDSKLAFLRALYTVKPIVLALPITWAGSKP